MLALGEWTFVEEVCTVLKSGKILRLLATLGWDGDPSSTGSSGCVPFISCSPIRPSDLVDFRDTCYSLLTTHVLKTLVESSHSSASEWKQWEISK